MPRRLHVVLFVLCLLFVVIAVRAPQAQDAPPVSSVGPFTGHWIEWQ